MVTSNGRIFQSFRFYSRFLQFKNLVHIIACSEVFIETTKNLELQSATWSEYTHHNTIKFLICVAPNSSIIWISDCYSGLISDKALIKESGFLDELPSYSSIMTDKRFNLFEKNILLYPQEDQVLYR